MIYAILAVLMFSAASARADVTPADIERVVTAPLVHPYLYFTEAEKPAILARIANDRECGGIYDRLLAEGNRLLHTPVDTDPPAQDPRAGFRRFDARLAYLRGNAGNAHKLAFLYQMTGDTRYAEKAFEFADTVCNLPTWVDRRHQFPVIYSRVWPWGVGDDQASFAVDLETTDTARVLAIVYDWLYPALDRRQRDRIRGAMLEKAILPVRGNYEYHWWASSYRCNWCACCNAGLGTVSLALLTEDPNLVDVVAESVNRINRQFDEVGIDGGWQEGCGYYRKGIHALNFFADPLKRLTRGGIDLYRHPRIASNPITFLLYNMVTPQRLIPIGDSGYNRAGTSHIWNKLAEETGSAETAWFREYMWGEGRDIFDIIWPRPSVKPALPKVASKHFRTIDWAIMRSDFTDPDKCVVACKAGMHDDPHHGHLDCGHFIVYWRNQEYIADIGSPAYDELYFDEVRWEYPQASSDGHNVIFVNGEQQIPAKLKNSPWREGVGGRIVDFQTSGTRDYTLMDPSGAYPGKELRGWRRHVVLDKPDAVIILDEVRSAPGAEIEARFHSNASIRIVPDDCFVLLDGDEGLMALVPVVEDGFSLREGRHPSLPVLEGETFRWIPYVGAVVRAAHATTLIASIAVPVEDLTEAADIARSARLTPGGSGGVSVSFTRHGETLNVSFVQDSDSGLILK